MRQPRGTRTTAVLVSILAVYAAGRLLEVASGRPRTLIVAVEVLSAMAFALVDGARHHGVRGILIFAGICAVIGNVVEDLGVATGFPFGRYEFLTLMGPRLFHVPVLLGLAYDGMAYVSWMLARIVVGARDARSLAVPPVAAVIMTAWDWAQDPVWSTLLHAWRWKNGGPWFGVPLSNYGGWLFADLLIYMAFSVYVRRRPELEAGTQWPAVVFYGLCAAGNAAQAFTRLPQQVVMDASGRAWRVGDILAASALVSVFVMGGFAAIAALRLGRRPRLRVNAEARLGQ
jgi:uncharacterized membrane protein